MAENLGANFSIDITQLKAGLAQANRLIRESESEFKAAAAGMQDWTKTQEGLEKKIQSLGKIIELQDAKVTALKSEYERLISEGLDPTSAKAADLRTKINNETAALEKSKAELERQKTALQNMRDEADKAANHTETLTEKVERQENELKQLKDKYIEVATQQGKNSDEAKALADEISDLSGELKDNKDKLNEASDAANDLDKSFDKAEKGGLQSFAVALGNLASSLIQSAISKMQDLISNTIEVGQTFEKSMDNVQAISGASAEDMEKLTQTAKEYGSTTQFSASEAADALGYMALAGWDAEKSTSALGGILDLAAASGMELASASDMVTDYMSAFNMTANKSAYFADVLAYAQGNANTTAAALGEAFKNCAANMNAAGQDFETTTAFLSMMANQGLKGSEAGTALTAVMRDMTAKMKDGKIAIGDASVEVMDAQGNYRDLTDILLDVETATQGMGDAERATALQSTFTADSIKGLNLILNAGVQEAANFESDLRGASVTLSGFEKAAAESGIPLDELKNKLNEAGISNEEFADALKGSEGSAELFTESLGEWLPKGQHIGDILGDLGISLDDLQGAMNDASGTSKNMADIMNDNLGGDLTSLGSKFEGIQIALYDKFEPALRAAVDALSKLLDVFNWLIDNGAEVAGVVTGVATAVGTFLAIVNRQAILTAFLGGLKAIKTAFLGVNAVMAANPIGLVIAAVAGLVAAFVVLWNKSEKFRNFWKGLWAGIKKTAEPIIKALAEWFADAWEKIKEIWGAVTAWFSGVWDGIKAVFSAIGDFFSGIFSAAWDGIKAIWSAVAKWFNDKVIKPIKAFFTPLVEFFKAAWNIIKQLAVGCWNAIKAVWSVVFNWYKSHVIDPIVNFFTSAWNIIKQLAQGCWNLIKAVWSVVANWFKTHIIEPIAKFFTALWDGIKKAAQATWDGIKAVWSAVSNWFNTYIITPVSNFFTGLWSGIKSAAAAAWDGIKGVWNTVSGWFNDKIISPIKNWFGGMWDNVKSGAGKAWDGIKSVFGGVADWFKEKFSAAWQKVKDVFSTGGKVFDGIKDGIVSAFKTVVNAIIRGINKVIAIPFNAINGILDKIQAVSIAGIQPFEGLVSRLPVPEIPELAKGGVLHKGKVGFLEGDGDEAVVPLERNTGWINKLAAKLTENLGDITNTDGIAAAIKTAATTLAQKFGETIKAGAQTISGAVSSIDLQTAQETGAVAKRAAQTITTGSAAETAQRFGNDSGWMDTLAEKLADKIGGGVTVNQTNNYSQAHSRYEIYKSKQATETAVKLALAAR